MKLVNTFTGELVDGNFQTTVLTLVENQAEHPDTKSITETAHVPLDLVIEDMMDAGRRLDAYRRARFDSVQLNTPDEEDPPLDPTREPNVDIVDLTKAVQPVLDKLSALKKQHEKDEADQKKLDFEKAVDEEIAKRAKKPDQATPENP